MAETGHAVNVSNFAKMISFCEGYGAPYDPTNADLTVANLHALHDQAGVDMEGVTGTLAPWKTAVNNRQSAFEGIRKLVTRVVNSFAASGVDDNAVEDAKGFKRKIDGARAKTLPPDDPLTPDDESKGNSVSQQSYVQLVEHLDELIALLDDNGFNPNETDLKVPALNAYSTTLKTENADVIAAAMPLSNARIARDETLYGDSGLVDRAGLVKKYVKSVFGADSPQYGQISGLEFTRPKK